MTTTQSPFAGYFARAAQNATKPNDYGNRFPPGTFRIILERYEIVSAPKNRNQLIVEADFTVVESNTQLVQVGETRRQSWHLDSDEYGYSNGRAIEFVEVIGKCLGDPTPASQLGEQLQSPGQPGRGITMLLTVYQEMNRDGSPKLSKKKGEPIFVQNFAPAPNTSEQIAAFRARLDAEKPSQYGKRAAQQAAQPQGFGPPAGGFQPVQPAAGYAQQYNQAPQGFAPQGPPPGVPAQAQPQWGGPAQPAPQGPPPVAQQPPQWAPVQPAPSQQPAWGAPVLGGVPHRG